MSRGATRVDLRLLLLVGPDDDPTTVAWRAGLRREGVPFDERRPTGTAPLSEADLVHPGDPSRGRYQGVVLTTDSSTFWGGLQALDAYRRRFDVRQVHGFEFPRASLGLQECSGEPMTGVTAELTPAGRRVFPELVGPTPIADGSFGYPATPADERFVPYVVARGGTVLVGGFAGDGGERLVITVNYGDPMLHWRLLFRGLLGWVTRGVHLGLSRNNLTCHVDDVFLANWRTRAGTDDDGPAPTVRMAPDDAEAVAQWQRDRDFTLDLVFNGAGAQAADDTLTEALLSRRESFRWVNHTWNHVHFGAVDGAVDPDQPLGPQWRSVDDMCDEIERNERWAASVGIEHDAGELVTGAHSGLDNPGLATALARSGIDVLATDASRARHQQDLGAVATVPRYPTSVYTDVCTWPEQLGLYAARYAVAVPTREAFLRAESAMVLLHVLGNDPRPTFAHQSNLVADRLLLALLDAVLDLYGSHVRRTAAPLVSPTMRAAAVELDRQDRWRRAVEAGAVTAHREHRSVLLTAGDDVEVPLTVPPGTYRWGRVRRVGFGAPYAGSASGWHRLSPGETLRLHLPRRQRTTTEKSA